MSKFILTLSCPDKIGIVANVSGFLAAEKCNILESAQFNDTYSNKFFMRVVFDAPTAFAPEQFAAIGADFSMSWHMHDCAKRQRVVILVSKESHCLNHLLHKRRIGAMNIEVPAVISNHPDLKEMAEWHKIPFHLVANKDEKALLELFDKYKSKIRYLLIDYYPLKLTIHGFTRTIKEII
jgi:formyltetrahydrofolate deformylase